MIVNSRWIPADTSLTFHTDEPSYSGNNEHTVLLGFPYGHLSEKRLRPSRHIDIQFKGDLDSRGYLYVLRRIEEATRKNGSENEITMCLTLPETPPSQEEFAVWVKQSVNQAARQLFQEVYWLLRHRRAHLFGGSGPTSRIRYYFSCCGCVAPRCRRA